ncbi:MAG: transposase [Tateyamaria sp.]|jgi:transposase|uniref:transposase n=1 Tax=unclassified Tateyamaria TaxID=2645127 RepID=UPI000D55EDDD|nr:transposase [Tateyamaria sp. Alg231-49]
MFVYSIPLHTEVRQCRTSPADDDRLLNPDGTVRRNQLEQQGGFVASPDVGGARLRTIPGVGPITVASIGDGHQFSNGRSFAAPLGLTPLNQSSGSRERLGRT